MAISIDLNADLGEHENSLLDEEIMPYISSCNIACGGHAGDENSVKTTIDLAISNEVAIGAHPSFPDRENFGREIMNISPEKLKKSLLQQIMLVKEVAQARGCDIHHIKPHGALYNLAAADEKTSLLIIEVVKEVESNMKLYGLASSVTEKVCAQENIEFIPESFADRKYEDDRTLRSRKKNGAVLEGSEVIQQVENLVLHQKVMASTQWIDIPSKSICLHSDTPGSVTLAQKINEYLVRKGVIIVAV